MNPEDIEFQKVVMEGLVPKLMDSTVAVCLTPSEENFVDAKFCVELGVMIMLDKPIIAIVAPGAEVPEKLRKVADEIVEADLETAEGRRELSFRIKAFTEKHS